MTEAKDIGFVLGGPVDFRAPVYVTRKRFETLVFEEIQRRNYVSIIGSRQVGKTSLLQRIQSEVETRFDYASALIDLSTINEPNVDFRIWASEFCDRVSDQLRPYLLDRPLPELPTSPVGFRRYFQSLADIVAKPSILILIDEASAIPTDIGDPFYSIIRWIYTNRNEVRPVESLQRFNFAFAGVFEPEKLVRDRNNSPFNVSHVARVPDFALPELESLVSCISDARVQQNPAALARAIYHWTEGHPFLSHCFCALLADILKADLATVVNSSVVDQLRARLKELAGSNIDHVVKLSLDAPESAALIRQLLDGATVPFSRGRAVIVRLELIGAISEDENGRCRIRNRIYEETFQQSVEKLRDSDAASEPRPTIDNAKLRQVLATKFTMDELRALCDDLHIQLANIQGDTLEAKARELIAYMERRDTLDLLAQAVKRERPRSDLG